MVLMPLLKSVAITEAVRLPVPVAIGSVPSMPRRRISRILP
jgi:hypothetical protein